MSCINITFKNTNNVTCPRCFSNKICLFGKDINGSQKYQCKDCKKQFTLIHKKHDILYFPCPVCGKATFIWHKYDSYIHFKCGNKKCNHSFKLPIFIPHLLKSRINLPHLNPFKYFKFPVNIIISSLNLYFACSSSLRQVQSIIIKFYSIYVSHVSIYNWIRHFSHIFKIISHSLLSTTNLYSDEWHADETFIKINGFTHYLWLIIDSETRLIISFHLSSRRDSNNALKLFELSRSVSDIEPLTLITDNLFAYNMPAFMFYPNSIHYSYHSFSDFLNNNLIESFNKTFKAWYKTKKCFKNFDSALDLITTFFFYYNFIRCHSSLNNLSPAQVAGVNYSNRKVANWLLF